MSEHFQLKKKTSASRLSAGPAPTAAQFKDDRAATSEIKQLQKAADDSEQVQELTQLKAAVNSSEQVSETAALQAKTNGGAVAQKKGKKDPVPDHDSSDFGKKKEKKALAKSATEAFKMIKKAQGNVSKTNKKYKKWMDAGSTDTANQDTRVAHVKAGVDKIKDTLENDQIIFKQYGLNDGEEDDTYAYVQPSDKDHNIYLGGAFWVARTKGWNSRAGTIIHELSHRLHGTDDHAYGKVDAKDLAKNDPDKATTNADNYEFLAEGS